jgi:uncharacterized protein YkwD
MKIPLMKPLPLFALMLSLCLLTSATRIPEKVSVCLSDEEQLLYDMIMEYRKSKGLKPIPLSARLSQVAQIHARDLVENYSFAPDNPCNPHSWSSKGKWSPCCYTSDHKQAQCMWDKPREINGYAAPGYEIAYYSSKGASAEEGLSGWKKSPSHNPLIINSGMWKKIEWRAIGIGIYGEYGIVWFGEHADDQEPGACR